MADIVHGLELQHSFKSKSCIKAIQTWHNIKYSHNLILVGIYLMQKSKNKKI